MTRLVLALMILAAPAFAAGDAGPPMAEPQGIPVVRIAEVLWDEPVPGMAVEVSSGDMAQVAQAFGTAPGAWFGGSTGDDPLYCGIDLDCGDWIATPGPQPLPPGVKPPPEPAPIPLPWPGLLLAAAIAALTRWRRA